MRFTAHLQRPASSHTRKCTADAIKTPEQLPTSLYIDDTHDTLLETAQLLSLQKLPEYNTFQVVYTA